MFSSASTWMGDPWFLQWCRFWVSQVDYIRGGSVFDELMEDDIALPLKGELVTL